MFQIVCPVLRECRVQLERQWAIDKDIYDYGQTVKWYGKNSPLRLGEGLERRELFPTRSLGGPLSGDISELTAT